MKKMRNQPRAIRTVQSVDRAVMILELLASEPEGLSLGKLAGRMRLYPQTAQGLLRTLESHELVVQAGRASPYMLGPRVHHLSRKWTRGQDRAMLARSTVRDLCRAIGEYLLLAELRGMTIVRLLEANPGRALMVTPEPETPSNLHTMATGKLLMAFLDDERRRRLVDSLNLEKRGPRSVTDRNELLRQLEKVRRQGYVVCIEEAGACCAAVAVPVRDASGEVVAALGAALPLVRFPTRRRKRFREKLQAGAAEIERSWGGGDCSSQ